MLFPKVLIIFSDEYDIIFQSIKDMVVLIITPSYRELHRASSDKKSLIQKFEIQKNNAKNTETFVVSSKNSFES